ncbi:hypothetical protein RN001_006516 [Aquatica leii]|uniref:Uncharacterized protein n=1 Tax=Aquatica leii TaxID=1421715 RepID=A0AAN7PDM3_9COLE|nr:hypothetical protein RN001_006516 [Aquatica leii]
MAKRLGQAVEQINSTDDNTPVSILLIPPEVDIQTDEEDVDDDDLLSSSIPKDVPGEVEVVYDSDEDDDTIPLSIIQDMLHKARHNPKNTKTHVPNWSDDLENLEEMEGTYTPEIICKLASTLKDLAPVKLFEKLLDVVRVVQQRFLGEEFLETDLGGEG